MTMRTAVFSFREGRQLCDRGLDHHFTIMTDGIQARLVRPLSTNSVIEIM